MPNKKGIATTSIHEWKTTPKATKTPTVRDLERAAGFLEGEGCFVRYYDNRNRLACQAVRATQVNREPLDWLSSWLGGRVRFYAKSGKNGVWLWGVSGPRARGVMMTLYGLMSQKRRAQIRKALGKED